MVKLRKGDAWMPAREYSRSLHGLSLNLVVRDIERSLVFHRTVLGAEVVYSDPDFAVLRGYGADWMLHADHTYRDSAFAAILRSGGQRGTGAELRLHGRDPDEAEAAAGRLGFEVLVATTTKGHGLREVVLVDPDGYIWVPDVDADG